MSDIFKTKIINPIVIGKNRSPQSFNKQNPNCIVEYFFNKPAWMTKYIFEEFQIK